VEGLRPELKLLAAELAGPTIAGATHDRAGPKSITKQTKNL